MAIFHKGQWQHMWVIKQNKNMKGCHWHKIWCEKKFCVLQKKVLSFGPNRTVEVRPNSSAEPNVRSITSLKAASWTLCVGESIPPQLSSLTVRRNIFKLFMKSNLVLIAYNLSSPFFFFDKLYWAKWYLSKQEEVRYVSN